MKTGTKEVLQPQLQSGTWTTVPICRNLQFAWISCKKRGQTESTNLEFQASESSGFLLCWPISVGKMFQLTHRRWVFEKPILKSFEAVLEGSEVLLLRCKMPLRRAGKLMLKCSDKACQCHQQNQPQLNMNNPCSPTIGNFYNKHLDDSHLSA